MADRELPSVEILGAGDDLGRATHRRGWTTGSWRDAPIRSALAVGALIVGLVVAGLRLWGGDDDPRTALARWAAGQHAVDPPAGVQVPEVACDEDPYDLEGVRGCLRAAHDAGVGAVGHLQVDFSYPDALDQWVELAPDGTASVTERTLTVEPRPDLDAGAIASSDLRRLETTWRVHSCASLAFTDEVDVYPGIECLDPSGAPPDPRSTATDARPTTADERAQLVRAFACTYPDELPEERC